MMKILKHTIKTIFFIFLLTSCSSKKSVVYMQDLDTNLDYNFKTKEYLLKKGDILKISVMTQQQETLLNLDGNLNSGNLNLTRETLTFKGYPIDNNGFIDYPEIGKISSVGLSTNQLSEKISKKLSEMNILSNPIIEIKVLNLNFTILGEIQNPGRYFFDEPNLNILQAFGIAGDLTINGKRDEIKLIRMVGDDKLVMNIDLTKSDFLTQELFQIMSGDIIVVNPNTSRVKNAGIIGNSGTLLSLLSFLLSSIIVISR